MQDYGISIANTLKKPQYYTKPSKCVGTIGCMASLSFDTLGIDGTLQSRSICAPELQYIANRCLLLGKNKCHILSTDLLISEAYDRWQNVSQNSIRGEQIQYEMEIQTADNMMTSSNESIFRKTGPLCGEFTGQRPVTRSFYVFFDQEAS